MAKKFNLAEVLNLPEKPVFELNHGEELVEVNPYNLLENELNFYDVSNLHELVDDIRMQGVLQPLLVKEIPNNPGVYKVVSGHRRRRAAQLAGLETVPCRIVKPENEIMEELMLITSNSTTRKLTNVEMVEQAKRLTAAYEVLKAQGKLTGRIRESVAEQMGVSDSKLAKMQAIDNNLVQPEFRMMWERSEITEQLAYELSKLSPEEQAEFASATEAMMYPLTVGGLTAWKQQKEQAEQIEKMEFCIEDPTPAAEAEPEEGKFSVQVEQLHPPAAPEGEKDEDVFELNTGKELPREELDYIICHEIDIVFRRNLYLAAASMSQSELGKAACDILRGFSWCGKGGGYSRYYGATFDYMARPDVIEFHVVVPGWNPKRKSISLSWFKFAGVVQELRAAGMLLTAEEEEELRQRQSAELAAAQQRIDGVRCKSAELRWKDTEEDEYPEVGDYCLVSDGRSADYCKWTGTDFVYVDYDGICAGTMWFLAPRPVWEDLE